MPLVIEETYEQIVDGKRYLLGDPVEYEPFTENLGDLFKSFQKEYGGCVSKIYQDVPDGTIVEVGWYFLRGDRGVWVTHKRRCSDAKTF